MSNEPDAPRSLDATASGGGTAVSAVEVLSGRRPKPPVRGPRAPGAPGRAAIVTTLLLAALSPSVFWIVRDRSLWPWDQSWYGEVSVELYRTLTTDRRAWPELMRSALPTKPPAIAWVGQFFVPLGHRLGRIEIGLLGSVLLAQLGTLALLYRTARHLAPNRAAIQAAACLFVASAPLFVGMSQNYFAEPLQTFAVAWVYCIAARGPLRSRLLQAAELIAAATVAMLAKTTTPLYCLLPGIVGIVWLFRRRATEPGTNWIAVWGGGPALLGAAGLATAAGMWYARNWGEVLRHARLSSVSEGALLYGSRRAFLEKLAYWTMGAQRSFLLEPILWAVAAGILVALIARIVERSRHVAPRHRLLDLLALAAAAHVGLALSAFSLTNNEETRYLLPMIVPLAVLLIWALAQLPDWSFAATISVLLAGQWAMVHLQSLGRIPLRGDVTPWLIPVETDADRYEEVDRLVRSTMNAEIRGRINTIGVEYPWFNFNTCNFLAAQAALEGLPRCSYTSLGYAESDIERAWNRLTKDINSPYFVSVTAEHRPSSDPFNGVTAPILDRVSTRDEFTRVPFHSHFGLIVFRRIESAP